MAHQRKIIRHAVRDLLISAATAAGSRVQGTRVDPNKKSQLPAIGVYTLNDPVNEDTSSDGEDTHELEVEIAGWVAHTDAVPADDAMDDLAEQIEAAMKSDPFLGGAVGGKGVRLLGTVMEVVEINGRSDPQVGIVVLTYAVPYFTALDTGEPVDDFLSVDATHQIVGANDGNAAEDTFLVRPWSLDSTSGIGVPADSAEWAKALAAAGISSGGPSHLYTCQGVSAATASRDDIGSVDLSQVGSSMLYDQPVAGWDRNAMTLPDGTIGNTGWQTAAIANLATTSVLLLLYVDITGSAAAEREIAGLGPGADHRSIALTAAAKIKATGLGGIASATASNTVPSGTFPVVLRNDRAAGTFRVYTPEEVLAPVYTNPTAGGSLFIIGDPNVLGSAPCAYLYAVLFEGAAAEMSDANVRSLLKTLGWTVGW